MYNLVHTTTSKKKRKDGTTLRNFWIPDTLYAQAQYIAEKKYMKITHLLIHLMVEDVNVFKEANVDVVDAKTGLIPPTANVRGKIRNVDGTQSLRNFILPDDLYQDVRGVAYHGPNGPRTPTHYIRELLQKAIDAYKESHPGEVNEKTGLLVG